MLLISQNNSTMGIIATLIDNEAVEFVSLYFVFCSFLSTGIAI